MNYNLIPISTISSTTIFVDTDGDGIDDEIDLDDDNDGILDDVECDPLSFDLSLGRQLYFESFETPVVNVRGDGQNRTTELGVINIGRNLIPDGWTKTSGDGIVLLTRSLDATPTTGASHGRQAVWLNEQKATIQSNTTFNLIAGRRYILFADVWRDNVDAATALGVRFGEARDELSISKAQGQDGVKQKLYLDFVATVNNTVPIILYEAGNTGASPVIDSLALYEFINPNICQDTDGDGITDEKDVDSDNDGCFDALEGTGSFTNANLSPSGVLLGTVNELGVINLAGVPQNVGTAHDNTLQAAVCSPCVNGTDTDGDGISDECDIDDDNDGILDLVECPNLDQLFYGQTLQDFFTAAGSAIITSTNEAQLTAEVNRQAGSINSTLTLDLKSNFKLDIEVYLGTFDGNGADGLAFVMHNDPAGVNAVGLSNEGLGAWGIKNGLVFEFDTWNNKAVFGDIAADHFAVYDSDSGDPKIRSNNSPNYIISATPLSNIEDGEWHDFNVTWNAATQTLIAFFDGIQMGTISGDLANDYFGGSDEFRLAFTAATGALNNFQRVRLHPLTCDTDGDGIDDYLDLDSDGNNCFDAIESGHNQTAQIDGTIAGPYGENGLANSIEVNDTDNTNTTYVLNQSSGINDFQNNTVTVCDHCDLTVEVNAPIYNDNGTPANLTDDTFTFTLLVNGSQSNGWRSGNITGNYGESINLGPYPVDQGGAVLVIHPIENPSCIKNISVNMDSCSYTETCNCCSN